MERRPLYWSIRRELWENRSIYIAPLAVAAFVLFAFAISTFSLPHRTRALSGLDPGKQRELVSMPYNAIAGLLMMTAFIVGVFYCLDALYGERRDRSILFWKSMPVSDRTAVLSKIAIPLVVMPVIVYVLALIVQTIMLFMSTVALLGNPSGLALHWQNVEFFQTAIAVFYALVAIALWHAPLYGWLLVISAWAKRAAVLWAILPFIVIGIFERMVFNTHWFMKQVIGYRVTGWFTEAFLVTPKGQTPPADPLANLTPGKFLSAPGLWFGLLFAALFIAAAVRLRRGREPI